MVAETHADRELFIARKLSITIDPSPLFGVDMKLVRGIVETHLSQPQASPHKSYVWQVRCYAMIAWASAMLACGAAYVAIAKG